VQNVVEMPRIPLLALIENRMTQSEDEVALREVLKNQPASVPSLVNTLASMPEKKIDQIVDIN